MLPSNYSFPEGDLLHSLVELYFEHVNLFTPLLHRPTFERLIQNRMHIKDASIGAVVLLVSALGSRFSEDPRVRVHGTTLSSGWQWYHQAEEIEERLLAPASLYNIQLSFVGSSAPFRNLFTSADAYKIQLRAQFMMGTCDSKQTWTITGIGLRRAQVRSCHLRSSPASSQSSCRMWARTDGRHSAWRSPLNASCGSELGGTQLPSTLTWSHNLSSDSGAWWFWTELPVLLWASRVSLMAGSTYFLLDSLAHI